MAAIKEKEKTIDRVVLVSDDDTLCRIVNVEKEEDGNLYCGDMILPVQDASLVKISDLGRVFFYNCSIAYINEIYHLAEVEKNLVIKKALVFKGETEEKKGPGFFTYLVVIGLIVAIIFK